MFFGFKLFSKNKQKRRAADFAAVKKEVEDFMQKDTSGDEKNQAFDGFRLVVDFETEKSEKYFDNPTAEMIDEVLDQMSNNLVNFIIVEHSKSVGGCVFVQCMWGGDGVYQVEAQVRRRDNNGVLRNQYREFMENLTQVKNLFRAFLAGQAPDIRNWEHMDDFDFYED